MQKAIEALDTLALALVDHGHTWTDEERQLYEAAIDRLIPSAGSTATDLSASRKFLRRSPSSKPNPLSSPT